MKRRKELIAEKRVVLVPVKITICPLCGAVTHEHYEKVTHVSENEHIWRPKIHD